MNKSHIIKIEMTERGEIKSGLFRITSPSPSTLSTVRNSIKSTMASLPPDSYDIPTLCTTLQLRYGMRIQAIYPDITVSDAE